MYHADVLTVARTLGAKSHPTEVILYLYISQAHPRTPGDTPIRRRADTEPVRNGPLPGLVIYQPHKRTEALPVCLTDQRRCSVTGDALPPSHIREPANERDFLCRFGRKSQ